MVRTSAALQEATLRVLRAKGISRRKAEDITNVSYSTIEAMTRGKVPGADHVILFAHAFDEDVAEWLDMCGYGDIATIFRSQREFDQRREIDGLLDQLPVGVRARAREASLKAIQTLIVPLLSEAG